MRKFLCLVLGISGILPGIVTYGANLNLNKGIFSLKCGEYQVDITSECKYSIRNIRYNGYLIGTPTGYYGTVINTGKGKYIGAGHTEGGEEKLLDIELTVDGKTFKPETGQLYEGDKIILKRVSKLDNLKLTAIITLTSDGIKDQRQFEAEEDQKLSYLYLFMYCFTSKTTDWLAMLPDGKTISGKFKNDKKFLVREDVKWAAQFDDKANTGLLIFYPEVLKGKAHKTTFWDVPKAYHKFYLMLDVPPVIKKGYTSSPMTVLIKGFSGKKSGWHAEVEKIANQLE